MAKKKDKERKADKNLTATTRKRPEPIPWRRVAWPLAPQRRDVIGMVALSTGGRDTGDRAAVSAATGRETA
ncbi:MAG: hypothetical protein ACYCXW_13260 [Solirubrobacteraceae bacterium]